MSSHLSPQDLSTLIHEVSAATTQARTLAEAAQQTVRSIHRALNASRVELKLIPAVHRPVTARAGFAADDPEAPAPSFLFARPVAVRRVEYGRLEVDLAQPSVAAPVLMLALETVTQLIALRAERESLRDEQNQLNSELLSEKLLVRAAGVVAAQRGTSLKEGRHWILSEATRTQRTALELADRIVLHHESRKNLARDAAGLRRTA